MATPEDLEKLEFFLKEIIRLFGEAEKPIGRFARDIDGRPIKWPKGVK
jgi:hypothetical protein